jgi:Protein of unknown function (DUF4239)
MEWFAPIMFVFVVTAAAVIGLLLVRRRVDHAALARHNNVATAVFSVLGTLLTVLLAFVVIVVWESEDKAVERTALEAGVLGDLMRDAGLFPDPERTELRNELREYGQAVINEEWPAMASGESSPHVWDVVNRLFDSFSRLKPAAPWEVNIHSEMLTRLNDLSDHRRWRLLSANSKVPPLLWGVLGAGTLITLGFSYFLGVQGDRAHVLITGSLAAMIAMTLYLVFAMDRPFAGALHVKPDAFRVVMEKVAVLSR